VLILIRSQALIEGKFQNPKLAKYARTHAIAEAVDFLLHAVGFCGAIYYIPELIPLMYAGKFDPSDVDLALTILLS